MNATVIKSANAGLAGRVLGFLGGLNAARLRYTTYRTTLRELEGLSDRELLDLGLHRSMIDSVALESAYGK